MIILNTKKTTGKQVYKIIMLAVKELSNKEQQSYTKRDFCESSGLGRSTLHRFQFGERPGPQALVRIAQGLTDWGFETRIEFE